MEGKYFSVKEAARILGCTPRHVHNLLAKGWISSPVGRPKHGESVRISVKSVFQLQFFDHLTSLPARVLRELKSGRRNFARFLGKHAIANRFSMDERESRTESISPSSPSCSTDPSPYPLPQGEGENNNQRKRCLHHEFAEQHQFSFGWRARQLAPDDPAMQEMSLAVLEYNRPANFEYLYELAGNRAIDYLRYEAARGKLSLSQARAASDTLAEKMASLNAFIDDLMQRGVPAEWIEEVLGERLDVA